MTNHQRFKPKFIQTNKSCYVTALTQPLKKCLPLVLYHSH